jgi:hypothetical protein
MERASEKPLAKVEAPDQTAQQQKVNVEATTET